MQDRGLQFLRQAIALARSARQAGDHPFGALLVHDGQVLAKAKNSVVTGRDPTCHAEMNLVRRAARLAPAVLSESTLYASTEPCAMCSGAIYWVGIRRVIYALATEELAVLTGGSLAIPCRDIFARARIPVDVHGPLDLPEAREVHQGYWTVDDRPRP